MSIVSTVVRILFLLSLSESPALSTLVIYQWTPQTIYLAADSLTIHTINGISSSVECKIHQVGDVFFTIVGINRDPTIKVDLVAVAIKAANTSGNVVHKFSTFETLAKSQIERALLKDAPAELRDGGPERLHIIFVDRGSHALVAREYIRKKDGSPDKQALTIVSPPRRDPAAEAIGQWDASKRAIRERPELNALRGVPFILPFMQAQIDYENGRLKKHLIARVGLPICILQIENGKASWVADHQGKCHAIQP